MGDVIPFPTNNGKLLREQADCLQSGVASFERKLDSAVKDAEELLGDVVVRQLFGDDPRPPEPVA